MNFRRPAWCMWSQRISVDFLRAGWCACALAHGAQGRGAGAGPLTCALCWCAAPCWRTVLFSQRRGWWGAFVGRAPRRAETLNRRTALSNATRDKQNTQANTKYRAEGHRNENNGATATRVPPPTQHYEHKDSKEQTTMKRPGATSIGKATCKQRQRC